MECLKLKEKLNNQNLQCEKILMEGDNSSHSGDSINQINMNHPVGSDQYKLLPDNNQHEIENNYDNKILEEFDKISELVRKEMNNLKKIDNDMTNLKNKISGFLKIKNSQQQNLNMNTFSKQAERQNQSDERGQLPMTNNFNPNISFKNSKSPEPEMSSAQMIGNLQLGNVSVAVLENLLKLNLLTKKQNENNSNINNNPNQTNRNDDVNMVNLINNNKNNNLRNNLNNPIDEKILKKLINSNETKSSNDLNIFKLNDINSMNNFVSNNPSNSISNIPQSSENEKHLETQIQTNSKSEAKKPKNQNLGISLSEIEKQIAMLKNLSINP